MEINKIEYIGEVCDCDFKEGTLTMCRSGLRAAGITTKHPEQEMIVFRAYVDKNHFDHPLKMVPGKYKIIIERIE